MAPEYPTPAMLALDTLETRAVELMVLLGNQRDDADDLARMAHRKHAGADATRARLNRLPLVRARILRSGS